MLNDSKNLKSEKMNIIVVGSVSFMNEMNKIKDDLIKYGHQVTVPPSAELGQTKEYWDEMKEKNFEEYKKVISQRNHAYFEKIKNSDAILVLNFTKNNIKNYIGPNTLMEIAVAFEHGKKIFLFNDFPENKFAHDELSFMSPTILNSDISKLD